MYGFVRPERSARKTHECPETVARSLILKRRTSGLVSLVRAAVVEQREADRMGVVLRHGAQVGPGRGPERDLHVRRRGVRG